jgi:hypothetical protein
MSSYSGLDSSRFRDKGQKQDGAGFFSSIGRALKAVPVLSTAASLAPGGKFISPLLKSQGLGKKRKRKATPKQQGGNIDLANLGKVALPLLRELKVVSKATKKIPKVGSTISKLAETQGLGKKRRKAKK